MLLLLTISVENLTGYNDIVWQFVLCTFTLFDQPTKGERVLKINKLVYIWLLFVQDENKDLNAVKTFLSMYSIHSSFPTFDIKMSEFCTFNIVTLTLSKGLLWISKKYFSIPCF